MADPFVTDVAALNVLGHHHTEPGGKNQHMMSGPSRMRKTMRLWREHGITVVALTELETPQAKVIERRPRWGLHRAEPNNRFHNGNEMGNGLAWRSDLLQFVEALDLDVPIVGRTLHMPVVLLLEPVSASRFAVMTVHNPSRGPISGGSDADRARCKAMQRGYAEQLADAGIPLIVAGDFNEVDAHRDLPDLELGFRSGVDFVMGAGVTFRGGHTVGGVKGVLSDHPLVAAVARIPADVPVRELPQVLPV